MLPHRKKPVPTVAAANAGYWPAAAARAAKLARSLRSDLEAEKQARAEADQGRAKVETELAVEKAERQRLQGEVDRLSRSSGGRS